MSRKVNIMTLREMKARNEPIASITTYDAGFARLVDAAGMDFILVGDSLGMVLQGHTDTLSVTVRDMIYHSRMVRRGTARCLLVVDMPYLSYTTPAQALGTAGRLMREGGAEVVKLEGGAWLAETVRHLDRFGIPVCAHLGLTPQSIHKLGGYRMQGRDAASAARILDDARTLQDAGAIMLVLECIPPDLAAEVSRALDIPVIGIGAGRDCDGQVLVLQDVLGISQRLPRFARDFLGETGTVPAALERYVSAVKSGEFPGPEHVPSG